MLADGMLVILVENHLNSGELEREAELENLKTLSWVVRDLCMKGRHKRNANLTKGPVRGTFECGILAVICQDYGAYITRANERGLCTHRARVPAHRGVR